VRREGPRSPEPGAASALPPEPSRFDEANSSSGPVGAANEGPTIGGGAAPTALFDRFQAKALDTDRSRFASLDGTSLVAIEGNTIRIGAPAAFHAERLRQRVEDLETLATDLFGQVVRISVEIATSKTPRSEHDQSRENSRKRRQEALNSESVNMAIDVLDAEIVEIRPLGESR